MLFYWLSLSPVNDTDLKHLGAKVLSFQAFWPAQCCAVRHCLVAVRLWPVPTVLSSCAWSSGGLWWLVLLTPRPEMCVFIHIKKRYTLQKLYSISSEWWHYQCWHLLNGINTLFDTRGINLVGSRSLFRTAARLKTEAVHLGNDWQGLNSPHCNAISMLTCT